MKPRKRIAAVVTALAATALACSGAPAAGASTGPSATAGKPGGYSLTAARREPRGRSKTTVVAARRAPKPKKHR